MMSKKRHAKTPARSMALFIVGILSIVGMLWLFVSSMPIGSGASARNPKLCAGVDKKWGKSGFCMVGGENACGGECICEPFRQGFKFGRCIIGPAQEPEPVDEGEPGEEQPTGAACNQTCAADADCATGFCYKPPAPECPVGSDCPDVVVESVCRLPACAEDNACGCAPLPPVVDNPPVDEPVNEAVCPQDLKRCPGNVFVKREGLNCQFPVCPQIIKQR